MPERPLGWEAESKGQGALKRPLLLSSSRRWEGMGIRRGDGINSRGIREDTESCFRPPPHTCTPSNCIIKKRQNINKPVMQPATSILTSVTKIKKNAPGTTCWKLASSHVYLVNLFRFICVAYVFSVWGCPLIPATRTTWTSGNFTPNCWGRYVHALPPSRGWRNFHAATSPVKHIDQNRGPRSI